MVKIIRTNIIRQPGSAKLATNPSMGTNTLDLDNFPKSKLVKFAPTSLLCYLSRQDASFLPDGFDRELYDFEHVVSPEAWYITPKGEKLTYAQEVGTDATLEYFLYRHNDSTPGKILDILKGDNNDGILCQVQTQLGTLCFFNEMTFKDKLLPDVGNEGLFALTGFLTKVNSVLEVKNLDHGIEGEINELKTSGEKNLNPNEYRIKATVVKKLDTGSYMDEGFYSYLVEIKKGGFTLRLPLVINSSRIFNYNNQYNPKDPLQEGAIIDCNIHFQGHFQN